MRSTKKKKNSSDNSHPEDRAKAAAACWDLFWLLESLELLDTEDIRKSFVEGGGQDGVSKYISTFGIPDAKLRR